MESKTRSALGNQLVHFQTDSTEPKVAEAPPEDGGGE